MRFIILPILHLLNFLFACVCFVFVLPWLLLWYFTWTDARDTALDVFEGITAGDVEFCIPAYVLTLVLSPFWLLYPLIYLHIIK